MNGSTQRPSFPVLAVLAITLGFATAPVATAGTGEVVLKFHEAKAKVEDTDTAFGNSNDFFPVVEVHGVPGVRAVREGRDHAKWESYEVRATVDTALRFYNAKVVLREDDTGPEDTFDIHPTSPKIGYDFTFDACTLRYKDDDLFPILGREAGPGKETDLPFGNGDGDGGGGGVDYDAKVTITITTGDGNPFTTDDVAIAEADPVQAAYGAEKIIEDKPLSFMLKLTNTFDHAVQTDISVTLDDGIAPRTELKTVLVPSSGGTFFLFDDDPYIPSKNPADPVLRYDVEVDTAEETFSPDDCETVNNALYGYTLPIVTTVDRLTIYRPFDAPIGLAPTSSRRPSWRRSTTPARSSGKRSSPSHR